MKCLKRYSILIFFSILVLSISFIDLLSSDKSFSELENKVLKTRPDFTFKKFLSGNFSPSFEAYINDQFFMRDRWIDLKSRSEFFLGKLENNGIIYGKDGFMFEKLDTFDEKVVQSNLTSIAQFSKRYNLPTTFALIPNAYAIYKGKLPQGAILVDQLKEIKDFYTTLSPTPLKALDFSEPFINAQDKMLYYKTDHHWNTSGAYLAYSTFVKSLGMEPINLENISSHKVRDFYGTYFSKSKLFNAVSDTIVYYDIPAKVTIDGKLYNSLYDSSKWQTRDKYAAFLWGNNGVTHIVSDHNLYHEEGKVSRLLVLKDSFANSFVPFLTYNFDEIYVVDLRSLAMHLSDFMADHTFDEVLIMYSFTNFVTDTNITRIKR